VNRAYAATAPGTKAAGEVLEKHWTRFKARDNQRAAVGASSVKKTLDTMSHGKCAYCEGKPWRDIDHHWPKAPAAANAGNGTPAKMFLWPNLLPTCTICNGADHKGSRMEWVGTGAALRPKLLDPGAAGDDPFCYFTIALVEEPATPLGWIDPRPDLTPEARERAAYTIELLGLNTRDAPLQGRQHAITLFGLVLGALVEHGPDGRLFTGRTVRGTFADLLAAEAAYLAPLRQMFRRSPIIKEGLVDRMPELRTLIEAWDLPPGDCAPVRGGG
jgi:uncharacterized protein (TIGR02646 family)